MSEPISEETYVLVTGNKEIETVYVCASDDDAAKLQAALNATLNENFVALRHCRADSYFIFDGDA